MKQFNTIEIERNDKTGTIWLNRPEKRNAFNIEMLEELITAYDLLIEDPAIRIIVLRGRGSVFCAGADLQWMKSALQESLEFNFRESMRLSDCFHRIYSCPKVTMCVVQGAAIGGANGLVAACDIAIALPDAKFSLSEVRIGLVPACIAPFILKRVGEFRARYLMLTGTRIQGDEAREYGLVNEVFAEDELEEKTDRLIKRLIAAGPEALRQCKELIFNIVNEQTYEESRPYTARMIAEIRKSDEAQEGMSAFLEKREPSWKIK